MRPASLLAVMILAKAIALAGRHVAITWWSPAAYLWQDAAVVIAAAALDLALARRQRLAWTLYGVLALYIAINIPVMRVLSTPLTWAMWRAARGPLADSIRYYVTWTNALLFLAMVAASVLAPLAFRRARVAPLLAGLLPLAALGPAAERRVDTYGQERNAWSVLVAGMLPRVASAHAADWRVTGFDRAPGEDLRRFRGGAAGRNIIFVSLESTAAQYLGLYGAAPDPAPRLTALAKSAIVFENAYAVYPESIKGLFSILCSAYPPFDSSGDTFAAAPCASLPGILRAVGYSTALFHSGRFGYLGMESVIRNRGFVTLADAGDIGGNRSSSFGVDEPSTVARILRWVDARPADRPFFVAYLPIAGHHPYESPDGGPFPDRDPFGRYRNALAYGDAALGALIDGVRARGLEDRTLWIVVGDHGEAFGQHDGNYGHTFQLYEENVHVPFLVIAPGLIRRQIRSSKIVSLIDTAPAVLEMIGAPPDERHHGRSVLDPSPRLAFFFADYSLGLLGLRDGSNKFIYELETDRPRLFDLAGDPAETTNLAARDPVRSRWYAQNVRAWIAAQQSLLRTSR
jgi:lipoteichoic acid synthase